jgi:hypothetical protein
MFMLRLLEFKHKLRDKKHVWEVWGLGIQDLEAVCVCVKVLLFKTRCLPSHVYKNLGYKQNQLV